MEAQEILGGDDDVIENGDVEDAAHLDQAVGKVFVGIGGGQITGGVVVDQDGADGILEHRYPKSFHGLDGGGGDAAQGNQFDEQDAVAGVEPHDPEVFFVPVDLVLAQQDLLHDGEEILAIDDLDLFLGGEFDVHGDSLGLPLDRLGFANAVRSHVSICLIQIPLCHMGLCLFSRSHAPGVGTHKRRACAAYRNAEPCRFPRSLDFTTRGADEKGYYGRFCSGSSSSTSAKKPTVGRSRYAAELATLTGLGDTGYDWR